MSTVFSHIVQKRLSQENENVATEALAFIVKSSEAARAGLMKLLRGIAPGMPDLQFRTQQTEGEARPDMCGLDGGIPRVFIENKFWAGLTDNQPVEYLKRLADHSNPAVLLAIVPETRVETVSREFTRRLHEASMSSSALERSPGIDRVEQVNLGPTYEASPFLAITSWNKVLSAIEAELAEEPLRRNDLHQLRDLCDAADDYVLFTASELTNQRIPALILQLASIVEGAVDRGITEGIVSKKTEGGKGQLGLGHRWDRFGRYTTFANPPGFGLWIGLDFRLWRERGSTPLWLYFSTTQFGKAFEARALLEPWALRHRIPTSVDADGGFAIGIDVMASEEKDHVIALILDQLSRIATELSRLPVRPEAIP